jgi:hypothetical protein
MLAGGAHDQHIAGRQRPRNLPGIVFPHPAPRKNERKAFTAMSPLLVGLETNNAPRKIIPSSHNPYSCLARARLDEAPARMMHVSRNCPVFNNSSPLEVFQKKTCAAP